MPTTIHVGPNDTTQKPKTAAHVSCVTRKCALRSLSSYPKKDWWGPARLSFFGYDTDYKIVLCCLHRLYSVVGVIPKEGLAGPMTTTKILRLIFSWHSSVTMPTWDLQIPHTNWESPVINTAEPCTTIGFVPGIWMRNPKPSRPAERRNYIC